MLNKNNLILFTIILIMICFKKSKKSKKLPLIKMSSLNYLNVAKRVGFCFNTYYNDFNNEGHMYPVHGVGDLDKTYELMKQIVNSVSGKVFSLTDLGINIKVSDKTLIKKNSFFDFHNIPTKHLDGSTKLPDGTRIEQHIPYFNKNAERDYGKNIAKIDWISGDAKFLYIPPTWDKRLLNIIPTTLSSTRETPFLKQNENLALSFFMDGKQSRVNNGGSISNYRYFVPGYATKINWFVAKAWVECSKNEKGCKKIRTTNNNSVYVRPRKESETDNLGKIAYNQNRYMETVSNTVTINNNNNKYNSFNQRYTKKSINFGDIMLLDQKSNNLKLDNNLQSVGNKIDKIFNKWVTNRHEELKEKQIAFYEIIHFISKYLDSKKQLPSPYSYLDSNSMAYKLFNYFKINFINKETYDISISALSTKSQLAKSYIPTPIGETGWMVVDKSDELKVPDDNGEYFIGWTIKTQPSTDVVTKSNNSINGEKKSIIRWCQTNGYTIHQGPGILFLTGGDMAHHGTQEPYLLKHNYKPVKRKEETIKQFKHRVKDQLPIVHWRLDKPSVIFKSNIKGQFTETNVGAAQNMLLSIGTKTKRNKKSRSPNFLGRYYQDLLSDPKKIKNLVNRKPKKSEVYQVVNASDNTFLFGKKQNKSVNLSNY